MCVFHCSYTVMTTIDQPHNDTVTGLSFRPRNCDMISDIAVTTSLDGTFKVQVYLIETTFVCVFDYSYTVITTVLLINPLIKLHMFCHHSALVLPLI